LGVGVNIFTISDRLKFVKPSPILALSQKARNLREEGRSIIDLTVGEPDFDTSDHIKDSANEAIRAGKTKYTALSGSPDLLDAIAGRVAINYELQVTRKNIVVTNGAKQAIHSAFAATLNDGDEVVLLAPFWTSYADIVRLEGGVPREILGRWSANEGWGLDLDAIEAAISPRTRWILLNSPCNPSGAVFSVSDLAGLAKILERHPQVWVLADDIYQDIAFTVPAPLFAALHPDLAARTLIVNGVSKAYAMTGWRIGWAVGPVPLIEAMVAVQSQTTSAPSSISQAAATAALRGPQARVQSMVEEFHRRRDYIVGRLNAIPGFECPTPGGAFYVFPRITAVLDRLNMASDTELCASLLQGGVAAVPGSAFGAPGYLRLSFAASEADLATACDRIETVCAGS
jgi:aspartate aminotransferase